MKKSLNNLTARSKANLQQIVAVFLLAVMLLAAIVAGSLVPTHRALADGGTGGSGGGPTSNPTPTPDGG